MAVLRLAGWSPAIDFLSASRLGLIAEFSSQSTAAVVAESR
jgi:hypothetical protein